MENFNNVQADHIVITTPQFFDEIVERIGSNVSNIYNLEKQIWLIPDGLTV